jgi:hypothetical protein
MSAFSESLNEDLFDNYFNDEEFGDAFSKLSSKFGGQGSLF